MYELAECARIFEFKVVHGAGVDVRRSFFAALQGPVDGMILKIASHDPLQT
jgi:hypothetical protein